MTKQATPRAARTKAPSDYPLSQSPAAAIRFTYRSLIQELQTVMAPYGITHGMWFFLRALWDEEGLTQRELGDRAGSMDSATVEQLREMERRGLISRRRSTTDRRKVHVYLTAEGRALKRQLIGYARQINEIAVCGLSDADVKTLQRVLEQIRHNLAVSRAVRSKQAPSKRG